MWANCGPFQLNTPSSHNVNFGPFDIPIEGAAEALF